MKIETCGYDLSKCPGPCEHSVPCEEIQNLKKQIAHVEEMRDGAWRSGINQAADIVSERDILTTIRNRMAGKVPDRDWNEFMETICKMAKVPVPA